MVLCREINPKGCSLQKKSFLLSGFKKRASINCAYIVGRFEEIAPWKTFWGLSIVRKNGESGIIYLNFTMDSFFTLQRLFLGLMRLSLLRKKY